MHLSRSLPMFFSNHCCKKDFSTSCFEQLFSLCVWSSLQQGINQCYKESWCANKSENQERSGLSCVSYSKGWIGKRNKWDIRHVFHMMVVPTLFLHGFLGHSSVQLDLKTSITGVHINNFAASNRLWPADKYF